MPIYLSSTFALEGVGKRRDYEYSRVTNPTRTALETSLASLEGGSSAQVFSSGMAAIAALVTMLKTGDHVICGAHVYGGTPRVFDKIFANYGIRFTYVDTSDPENVRRAFEPQTRLVHIESPTNPLMQLTDIAAVAAICHQHHANLSVDNTFMSPYFQRPIELGADIVMHSTTKFLNGHSDGLGGVLVSNRPELAEEFKFVQRTIGGILSPLECYLVLRGVKTLAVRMRQHDANGRIVAEHLARHPKVKRVFYPGLPDHPQYELAKRQMSGFGSLLAFETGSRENANRFLSRTRMAMMGASLGGVETLVSHPATMTHLDFSPEERAKIGVTDGLVRVSVGIEDAGDILDDLDQALSAI